MFDFMFLFVEFVFAEESFDGFVVLLRGWSLVCYQAGGGITYDFEDWPSILYSHPFDLSSFRDSEHLLKYSPRDHPRIFFRLKKQTKPKRVSKLRLSEAHKTD